MQDIQIFCKEMEETYYSKGYRKNHIRRDLRISRDSRDSHGLDTNIKKIINLISAENLDIGLYIEKIMYERT